MPKHKPYKIYTYKIPTFYVTMKIMVADKMASMLSDKIFELDENRDSYAKTAAALCLTYKDDIYLCLPTEGKFATEFMFHEIIHAKNFIYSKRGVKLDVDNDENEAYLVQYIYSKCEDAKKKFDKSQIPPTSERIYGIFQKKLHKPN
jgi:hypothetical protein